MVDEVCNVAPSDDGDGTSNSVCPRFVLGVNYPWTGNGTRAVSGGGSVTSSRCGWDFGVGPTPWWSATRHPVPRDWSSVHAKLQQLRQLGISVIRFWILADGINYPQVDWHPHATATGLLTRRLVLKPGVAPPPLHADFIEDFVGLCQACISAEMKIIPSLISFEWFKELNERGDGTTSQGRGELIFGPDGSGRFINPFLDATLTPLLHASRRVRDAIFAWEVINEPDWAIRHDHVSPDDMSRFIRAALYRIHGLNFRSTIGFLSHNPSWISAPLRRLLQTASRRGQYWHQFHHYPGYSLPSRLPAYDRLPFRPCMIGEFATDVPDPREAWGDCRPTEGNRNRYLYHRLEFLEQRSNYPMAFLWALNSNDGKTEWGTNQVNQIRAYMNGEPPP
ncbi:MAG: hypothetical protein AAF799_20525 [Myxococcota bacterium]